MQNISEQIEGARERLIEIKDRATAILKMCEDEEGRDLTEDEMAEMALLSEEGERVQKSITALEAAEKTLGLQVVRQAVPAAQPAAPAPGQPAAPAIVQARSLGSGKDRPKGDLFFKMASAALVSHLTRQPVDQVISERWSYDPEFCEYQKALSMRAQVLKSGVAPAATDVAGWAQELTDTANMGFLDLLRGRSAAAVAFARAGLPVSFDTYTGITIPSRAGGKQDLAPGWTGEGDVIPVKRGTFGSKTISPYKWGVISPFTKELALRSNPQIEALIRSFMLDDVGTQQDVDFFSDSAAVAGFSPAGILNGVTGTPADATGTTLAEKIENDLYNLLSPILNADMGQDILIFLHPTNGLAMNRILTATGVYLYREELSSGRLNGYPLITSTNLPTDEIIAIDVAHLAQGNGAPTFEASDVATLTMIDDDGVEPTLSPGHPRNPNTGHIGDAARDTTNNPPIQSMFQTNSVAVKFWQYMSWLMMRDGAVNRITGIDYSPQ